MMKNIYPSSSKVFKCLVPSIQNYSHKYDINKRKAGHLNNWYAIVVSAIFTIIKIIGKYFTNPLDAD